MPCRSSGIYFIMLPVQWKFLSLEKQTLVPQVIKQHYHTPFCSIMQTIIQMELLNGEKPSSLNIKILQRLPGVKKRIIRKKKKMESRKLLFIVSCVWLSMPLKGFFWLGRELGSRYLADWNISLSIYCEVSFKSFIS